MVDLGDMASGERSLGGQVLGCQGSRCVHSEINKIVLNGRSSDWFKDDVQIKPILPNLHDSFRMYRLIKTLLVVVNLALRHLRSRPRPAGHYWSLLALLINLNVVSNFQLRAGNEIINLLPSSRSYFAFEDKDVNTNFIQHSV